MAANVVALEQLYRPGKDGTFGVLHEQRLVHADLRLWRDAHGWTQTRLASVLGLAPSTVSHIETLRFYPPEAIRTRLAALTELPADRLFPSWLEEWITGEPIAVVDLHEVSMDDLPLRDRMVAPFDLDAVEADDERRVLRADVATALATVPAHERRVLGLRFGLEGNEPHTLSEIGKDLGVSQERVRQIEAKALRRLRHPGPLHRYAAASGCGRRTVASRPQHDRWQAWVGWLARHPKRHNDRPSMIAKIMFDEYPCCLEQPRLDTLRWHVATRHMPDTHANREFWAAWSDMVADLPGRFRTEAA